MSNFKETLMKAKLGDKNAINKIVNTYNALILKKVLWMASLIPICGSIFTIPCFIAFINSQSEP